MLNKKDVYKILKIVKSLNVNLWKSHYGKWNEFQKYYWMLKIEYYNGLSNFKSVNDEVHSDWNEFITSINKLIKNLIRRNNK